MADAANFVSLIAFVGTNETDETNAICETAESYRPKNPAKHASDQLQTNFGTLIDADQR